MSNFTRYKFIRGTPIEKALDQATDYALYEANRRVRKATKYLYNKILEAVSVTTFSIKQLHEKDHPYARRHKSIKISGLKVYNVHKRSGAWRVGFKKKTIDTTRNKNGYGLVVYSGGPRYASYIFTGTYKMLPRNPITGVSNERQVQKDMNTILVGTRAASRGFKI